MFSILWRSRANPLWHQQDPQWGGIWTRDYWMIYREPGSFSTPTPLPVARSLFVSLPVCRRSNLLTGEGGVGRACGSTVAKSYDCEKACSSVKNSILSDFDLLLCDRRGRGWWRRGDMLHWYMNLRSPYWKTPLYSAVRILLFLNVSLTLLSCLWTLHLFQGSVYCRWKHLFPSLCWYLDQCFGFSKSRIFSYFQIFYYNSVVVLAAGFFLFHI